MRQRRTLASPLSAMAAALAAVAGLAPLSAQEFGEFTLDRVLRSPQSLLPEQPTHRLFPAAPLLLEVHARDGEERAFLARIPALERQPLTSATDLRERLARAGAELPASPSLPDLEPRGADLLRFVAAGRVWHWKLGEELPRAVLTVPDGAARTAFAPADDAVAAIVADDLVVATADGARRRITWDGADQQVVYGDGAHRREFGIVDGLWWDPTGRRLAFSREDMRGITAYPYADYAPTQPATIHGRYPLAGARHSQVTIGVFDRNTARLVYLEHDRDADVYWTNVTFSPDGRDVYVALVARSQDRLELVRFDAATGAREATLLTESDPEWVEPEHGPIFLPDGSGFLWFSTRGGYRQLWRVAMDGTVQWCETPDRVDVQRFVGFDHARADRIWIETSNEDAREMHLWKVRLGRPRPAMALVAEGPKATRVTVPRGWHETTQGHGGWFLDRWSSIWSPGQVTLYHDDGRQLFVHQAIDPMAGTRSGGERFFDVIAEDGTVLHGHVILPPAPDVIARHPVLLYVYGGPHSQLVRNTWKGGANLWLHWMAAQGYVVVRLDGRGTSNRGIDFAQMVHRGLGEIEVVDQLAALHAVAQELPFADLSRVGVHGWSYGGYMTLRLMLTAPEQFHVGVAGAPVTDWAQYETGYGERYMDTPAENPEGYAASSVLPLVGNLAGKLLLVHGTDDRTVLFSHAMRFLDAAVDAGVDVDFMAYPMAQHGLRGKDREHFYRKMTRYFLDHLPPPPDRGNLGVGSYLAPIDTSSEFGR